MAYLPPGQAVVERERERERWGRRIFCPCIFIIHDYIVNAIIIVIVISSTSSSNGGGV